jgi:hypothetical protein
MLWDFLLADGCGCNGLIMKQLSFSKPMMTSMEHWPGVFLAFFSESSINDLRNVLGAVHSERCI